MLTPSHLQLAARCMTTFLIVSTLFVGPAYTQEATMGGSAGGGGDIVFCKSSNDTAILDRVSLEMMPTDHLSGLSANQIAILVSRSLAYENSFLAFSFFDFYFNFLKNTNERTWYTNKSPDGFLLPEIRDEFFLVNNDFCDPVNLQIAQVISRFETVPISYIDHIFLNGGEGLGPTPVSGNISYYYSSSIIADLKSNLPIDYVMLVAHEWMRDFTNNSRVIQEINRRLFSKESLIDRPYSNYNQNKIVSALLGVEGQKNLYHTTSSRGANYQGIAEELIKIFSEYKDKTSINTSARRELRKIYKSINFKLSEDSLFDDIFKKYNPSENLKAELKKEYEYYITHNVNSVELKILIDPEKSYLVLTNLINSLSTFEFSTRHNLESSRSHGSALQTSLALSKSIVEFYSHFKNNPLSHKYYFILTLHQTINKLNAVINLYYPEILNGCNAALETDILEYVVTTHKAGSGGIRTFNFMYESRFLNVTSLGNSKPSNTEFSPMEHLIKNQKMPILLHELLMSTDVQGIPVCK